MTVSVSEDMMDAIQIPNNKSFGRNFAWNGRDSLAQSGQ